MKKRSRNLQNQVQELVEEREFILQQTASDKDHVKKIRDDYESQVLTLKETTATLPRGK